MKTRYLCVHCDVRFEHEGGDDPRCPKCLRKNGLEVLPDAAVKPRLPRWVIPLVVVTSVAALAGAYVFWSRRTPDVVSGDAPVEPLAESELRGYLREKNADDPRLAGLFASNEAVRAFAREATRGKSTDADKAKGVTDRFRALARAGHFLPSPMLVPHAGNVRTAPETAAAIANAGARVEAYPLEIAALAVAALREAEVDVLLAEVFSFPGEDSPADPSGRLGYFAVALPTERGGYTLFDPYGGHSSMPSSDAYRVLSDVQAVSAAYDAAALAELVDQHDARAALATVEKALALDPRSPSSRSVRGAVLVASGMFEEGLAELEAAAQIRPDAPRHANLAGLLIATGETDRASREIDEAVRLSPGFASGHATRAAVEMASGDAESARSELELAERLDPSLFMLPMLWADFYLRSGDPTAAAGRAREAVRRRPSDFQTQMSAARVFQAAGLTDEMRSAAERAIELAPADQSDAVRAHLAEVLGEAAVGGSGAGPEAAGDDSVGAGGTGEVPSLQLGGGSSLLGGGSSSMGNRYRLTGPQNGLRIGQ